MNPYNETETPLRLKKFLMKEHAYKNNNSPSERISLHCGEWVAGC